MSLWLRRAVRAQLRDARVLFQESRNALFLFAAVLVSGALIFSSFYTYPDTQQHPGFVEALYATFAMVFL